MFDAARFGLPAAARAHNFAATSGTRVSDYILTRLAFNDDSNDDSVVMSNFTSTNTANQTKAIKNALLSEGSPGPTLSSRSRW